MAELLPILITRNLWISSLAEAIGVDPGQVYNLIVGAQEPDDAMRHNLELVLGGRWDGKISSDNAEIPPRLLSRKVAVTDPFADLPRNMPLAAVVKEWLDQCQIFTMNALIDALEYHGYKGVGRRNLGPLLRKFGYHSRQERVSGRVFRVWRFNPYRFGLDAASTRTGVVGVTTFDDVDANDPRYHKSASWDINLIHFLEENQRFTLPAVSKALGVTDLTALRRHLRRRRYKVVRGVWVAMGPDERHGKTVTRRVKRPTVQLTGYILTRHDPNRGELVLLTNKTYETIDIVRAGYAKPKVFRSVRRAMLAHPEHGVVKWTRAEQLAAKRTLDDVVNAG